MTTIDATTDDSQHWLAIREASELVGVSVATLRRWCDAGEVHAFTTPGGHRRFERAAVLRLAAGDGSNGSLACHGQTRARIVRAYRAELSGPRGITGHGPAFDQSFSGRTRMQLRRHGSAMVGALLEAIDGSDGDPAAALSRAREGACACAAIARQHGLSLADTLTLFVRFRRPFLRNVGAVASGQGVAVNDAADILVAASDALDELLPAVVGAYAS
jgi:excisionase family DNA binding protein